ncbi:hypothetical protein ACNKHX_18745 [Shigella flexneri]
MSLTVRRWRGRSTLLTGRTLTGALTAHMTNVRRVFNELIGDDESETQEKSLSERGVSCGRTRCRKMTLRQCWRIRARMIANRCNANCRFPQRAAISAPSGREDVRCSTSLMPHLLSDVCAREDAAVTLSRITALLVGIVTRTTYLELLSEFPRRLNI